MPGIPWATGDAAAAPPPGRDKCFMKRASARRCSDVAPESHRATAVESGVRSSDSLSPPGLRSDRPATSSSMLTTVADEPVVLADARPASRPLSAVAPPHLLSSGRTRGELAWEDEHSATLPRECAPVYGWAAAGRLDLAGERKAAAAPGPRGGGLHNDGNGPFEEWPPERALHLGERWAHMVSSGLACAPLLMPPPLSGGSVSGWSSGLGAGSLAGVDDFSLRRGEAAAAPTAARAVRKPCGSVGGTGRGELPLRRALATDSMPDGAPAGGLGVSEGSTAVGWAGAGGTIGRSVALAATPAAEAAAGARAGREPPPSAVASPTSRPSPDATTVPSSVAEDHPIGRALVICLRASFFLRRTAAVSRAETSCDVFLLSLSAARLCSSAKSAVCLWRASASPAAWSFIAMATPTGPGRERASSSASMPPAVLLSADAPPRRSTCTLATVAALAAWCSGVIPFASGADGFALAPKSSDITPSCASLDAQESAVRPSSSAESMVARALSSIATQGSEPPSEA
eukprot:scaffold4306_cov114-Isochrysis_galbana.AAC.5